MKIGLFGGTFDPIHRCHLLIASQVRERLRLDQVLFIPSGDPPHKPTDFLAPAAHRLEMVRLAIAPDAGFSVSDLELRRRSKSYSIDTVLQLQKQRPDDELYFIVGLDAFLDFSTWREAPKLLRLCHFVVVSRPDRQFVSLTAMPLFPPVSSDSLLDLDKGYEDLLSMTIPEGGGLFLLRLPPCDASASDIRRRIRAHEPLSNLLPAPVESYIIRHKLYQEETDRTGV
jgi:nicotinate-nucleotide adenylyltransferase